MAFVPNQKRLVYDGAGRITAEVFQPYGVERWRTSTSYGGDRTDVTPPQGGTATSKVVDARDRVTEIRQYKGPTPTPGTAGSWDSTTYQYDRKGQLTQVTDADANVWKYGYDLRGNQTSFVDPDKGASTSTYDNAGRVSTTTDARGKKVAYLYDPPGRKRAVYDNQVGGTLRAQWTYDTVVKGYLSQSVRMVGSAPYTLKILGYVDEKRNTIYVWEVKSYKGKGSLKASQEVQFYMKKLRATGRYEHVKAGFKLLPEPMFNAVSRW